MAEPKDIDETAFCNVQRELIVIAKWRKTAFVARMPSNQRLDCRILRDDRMKMKIVFKKDRVWQVGGFWGVARARTRCQTEIHTNATSALSDLVLVRRAMFLRLPSQGVNSFISYYSRVHSTRRLSYHTPHLIPSTRPQNQFKVTNTPWSLVTPS